jgi:hypothetical protein
MCSSAVLRNNYYNAGVGYLTVRREVYHDDDVQEALESGRSLSGECTWHADDNIFCGDPTVGTVSTLLRICTCRDYRPKAKAKLRRRMHGCKGQERG